VRPTLLAALTAIALIVGPGVVESAQAATWGICGISESSTKIVRTFNRVAGGGLASGVSRLLCGNQTRDTGWGYRHVLYRHMNDWLALADLAGGSDWRSMADWGINQALGWPAYVTYQGRNDTYTYKTQIQVRDSRDRLVSVKYCMSTYQSRR
jgi:hypothetical protein